MKELKIWKTKNKNIMDKYITVTLAENFFFARGVEASLGRYQAPVVELFL